MKKKFLSAFLSGVFFLGILMAAAPASAATYDFTQGAFEWHWDVAGITQAGATEYHVWLPGQYWKLSLTNTGVGAITELDLSLDVIEVADLISGYPGVLNFDVLVNSIDVGDFSLSVAGGIGLQTFNFTFGQITGDDYTIELIVKDALIYGAGSYNISLEGSSVSIVPVPGTMFLLIAGLAGIAGVRRKKR